MISLRLHLTFALLWAAFLPASLQAGTLALGPMVGHADASSMRIWVQTDGAQAVQLQLSTQEDFSAPLPNLELRTEAGNNFTGVFHCEDLEADTLYHYRILQGEEVLHSARARTAPPQGAPGRVRFAFSSCVGYRGQEALPSWLEMGQHMNFELLLMLGDNHYGDTTDLDAQRRAYTDHRQSPAVTKIFSQVPIYAIWDDHDFGPNNSDGSEPGKETSLRVFKEFWANPSYGEADNPGVYTAFSRGAVDFIMLDSRYHRSPKPKKDKNKKENKKENKKAGEPRQEAPRSMLGARQKAWLKKHLQSSRAPVKVVACGSEFQSQTTGDCWGGFKEERNEIMDFIRDHGITGVLFISGDRHFTAGYQVRGEIIEITAGPLGSRNFPNNSTKELLFNHQTGKMFCIYDIDTTGESPVATLEIYRAGEGLIDRHTYSWAQINGEKKMTNPLD